MQDLLRAHARLTWQILCAIDRKQCPPQGANDETNRVSPSRRRRCVLTPSKISCADLPDRRTRNVSACCAKRRGWSPPGTARRLNSARFISSGAIAIRRWCGIRACRPIARTGPRQVSTTGVCHLARNDAARADAAFSGLLERTRKPGEKDSLPELPEMHNNLGVARLRLGKWNEAGTEFERASALDPEEADYWINIAIAKLIGKQAAAAVAPLERARKIDPDDKGARALLIATLESLGRNPEAAAIRAESAENAEKTAPPNLQDGNGLARLARVSRTLDRTLLRPGRRSSRRAAAGREGTSQDRQRRRASMKDTGSRRAAMISPASYAWMLAMATLAVALTRRVHSASARAGRENFSGARGPGANPRIAHRRRNRAGDGGVCR